MSLLKNFKNVVIGKERDLQDRNIFRHLSLIAFFRYYAHSVIIHQILPLEKSNVICYI